MLKIGVLGSTKGTDLQAIIDAIESKELDAEIVLVASDKKNAFILERASKHNIETFSVDYKEFESREEAEKSIIEPSITVKEKMEIDLGERLLILTAYKTAHSHSDLTIFDSKTKTLWTGDLLFRERIPALDGSLKGWLSALEKIRKLDILTIIPGHGQATNKWIEAITAEEEYLNLLLNETRQAIAKGMFMGEILELVGNKEKEKWRLHEQHHKRNVSKAFTELEWE